MSHSYDYDYLVIGAGITGLAIAAELATRGSVLVLEKERAIGQGTSSRNSEVVHAGIYYPPGSLKARLCVAGRQEIEMLAEAGEIEYERVGKLIVAVSDVEVKSLFQLYENARRNGVTNLEKLSRQQLTKHEPEVKAQVGLLSPSTGIVSAHSLMNYYANRAKSLGADFVYASPVRGIRKFADGYEVTVTDFDKNPMTASSRCVVNAAGLYADEVARLAGLDVNGLGILQTWSVGYYYRANGLQAPLMKHLVYPVPARPATYLGVHATLDLGGGIKFGPTAHWLNEKREDYALPADCPPGVVDDIARYFPRIREFELEPVMAGIRAKIQQPGEGHRDFHIRECAEYGLPGFVNCCGIESPGLTAAPAVGKYVGKLLEG